MASNMYPYNRPTEGGVLNVTENGFVSLAGTNYSGININVSGGGGGNLGALQPFPLYSVSAPLVNDNLPNTKLSIYSISVENSEVANDFDRAPSQIAAGVVIQFSVDADKVGSIEFYSITPNSTLTRIETATQLDISVTEGETEDGFTPVSFAMPELNTEVFELLVVVYPG